MRWPWRALVYAVVALCVVTGVFVLERPWVGVGGLAVGAVAVYDCSWVLYRDGTQLDTF